MDLNNYGCVGVRVGARHFQNAVLEPYEMHRKNVFTVRETNAHQCEYILSWEDGKQICSSNLLSLYSFLLLSFLLTFCWLGCYCNMWLYYSPWNYLRVNVIVNGCRVAKVESPLPSQINECPHFLCLFLFFFFIQLIVTCGLWVIYRKDNSIYIYKMDRTVCCERKAVGLNHSFAHLG